MENAVCSELFRTPHIQVSTGMEQTWVGFELSTFPANVPSRDLFDYIQIGGGWIVAQKEIRGLLKGEAAAGRPRDVSPPFHRGAN